VGAPPSTWVQPEWALKVLKSNGKQPANHHEDSITNFAAKQGLDEVQILQSQTT
jgi:hypothetical protein